MNKQDKKSDHGHSHGSATHSLLPSDPALRVKAIETILLDKGLVDPAALDALIDTFQNKIGPKNGAAAVAKAWTDPEFKAWLLKDASAALASLGFSGMQGENMVAVENTAEIHNMVVCTLCSCYPWPVLGLPPSWYKSNAYRSRAVIEPRAVLAEFGVTLPEETEIRVWDSTAEIRYLVLPIQPEETKGKSEAELAEFVPRDAMIGTAL
jgi:nitrile hydratase